MKEFNRFGFCTECGVAHTSELRACADCQIATMVAELIALEASAPRATRPATRVIARRFAIASSLRALKEAA